VPEDDRPEDVSAGSTFWSGTITFGLVSVPVKLLAANRSDRVPLRMVAQDGTPLGRRYFDQEGRALEWEEIVRGYEIEKNSFVVVDDDELERLAPERTRDIDLRVFVPVSDIDPIHFERAYYLVPDGSSTKAYRLLARVMEETGRAGIATFVMRAKEYLVAILAENGILRAETLRFVEEVRTPESIGLPEPVDPKQAEVKRFEKEIGKLTAERLDTKLLADRATERVRKLVVKKSRSGKKVSASRMKATEDPQVIDLMEMLQRSLAGKESPPRSAGGADDDLESRSKAELYERAQKLDIPNRSGMSKDELVEAIRRSA
jgi:DNA end-binding protein Ku